MELVKVTNIGLKLTNGPVIPCIRAVLKDFEGNHTAEVVQELVYEIYELSQGATSICAYLAEGLRIDTTYIDYREGTFNYGDSDGLHATITCDISDYAPGSTYQSIQGNIYYKNNIVARIEQYRTTGSDYSYVVGIPIIYTDEDYNLIDTIYDSNNHANFVLMYSSYPGVGIENHVPVSTIQGGVYNTREGRWANVALYENSNIKEDITTEIDPATIKEDPYNPGGISGGEGGGGTFDETSDHIDIPSLPTLSAVDAGFITLFNPSVAQLKQLASYMWSGVFDLATFKKIFADPMDCILGLSIVPVHVPSTGTAEVKVGNISTGISLTNASRQYVEVDCGSIDVNEYWGAYLDYEPYTKCEIYLPYIGTHPLAIDDIMKKTVRVVYHVDILSGSCTAYVKCGSSVLYSFIGQCSSSIPITGNDWTNVINGALSIATAIGTMVATGGASAPMTTAQKIGSGVATGGQIASTAVNMMKPSIEKSGSMSGTGGLMAVQTPYLILTRPRQALPASQNRYMGYPAFITSSLDVLHGYTEMEHIHLEGISATDEEIDEIERILKTGVIL